MLTKAALENLAEIRLNEAVALLGAGLYPGAYYLGGYSAELGLKACIARAFQPDRSPIGGLLRKSILMTSENWLNSPDWRRTGEQGLLRIPSSPKTGNTLKHGRRTRVIPRRTRNLRVCSSRACATPITEYSNGSGYIGRGRRRRLEPNC